MGKEETSFPARQKTKSGEGSSIHLCLPNQGLSRVSGAGAEAGEEEEEEGEEARPPSEEEEEDVSRRQKGWFHEGRSSIFPHKGLFKSRPSRGRGSYRAPIQKLFRRVVSSCSRIDPPSSLRGSQTSKGIS